MLGLSRVQASIYVCVATMASDPEGSRTYTLEMGEKRYRLKRSQLTTAVIGRLFGLQRSSDDGDVETPNNEGEFKDISDFPVWRIEVGPCEAASHSSGSQVQSQRWSLGQPFYQPAGQSPEASASSSKWHPKNAVGKPNGKRTLKYLNYATVVQNTCTPTL